MRNAERAGPREAAPFSSLPAHSPLPLRPASRIPLLHSASSRIPHPAVLPCMLHRADSHHSPLTSASWNDPDRWRLGERLIRFRLVGALLLLAVARFPHRLIEVVVARRAGRLLENLGADGADSPRLAVRRRIALHV